MNALADHLPGIAAAYAILLAGALSPGPAVALLGGIAMGRGRRAALIAALGIACGSATLNIATLTGIGLLLDRAAWAATGLRWLGAAYLAWLAWGALRRAVRPSPPPATALRPAGTARLLAAGAALQVTNPKAVAFWLAIAAVAATQGAPLAIKAAFVAGGFAISLACHGAWALALSTTPVRAAHVRARPWIEGGLGVLFAAFALRLATGRT